MGNHTYDLIVSTMKQADFSLCDRMNIKSNAIIVNQTDCVLYQERIVNEKKIRMYSFDERGIGLSRNSGFMRSRADIISFADDDMVFTDTYEQDILEEFKKHPEADAILFYVEGNNGVRKTTQIKNFKRVGKAASRMFGGVNISVRREKLLYNNVSFSLLFGGGAKYLCGEDSLFILDMIRSGMKVYQSPIKIADVDLSESSWFNGINDRFFYNKGVLLAASYPKICYVISIFLSIKNSKNYYKTYFKTPHLIGCYFSGIKEFLSRR